MSAGRVIGFCSNFPVHSRSKQDKCAKATPYWTIYTISIQSAMLTGRVIGFCSNFPVHSRSKHDKAHRRKQGAGVVPYVKPLSRSNAAFGNLSQVELLLIFALLVSNSARGLASRLARGLALAATTVLSGLAKILGFDSLNTLHSIYPPINIDLWIHYITEFDRSQAAEQIF